MTGMEETMSAVLARATIGEQETGRKHHRVRSRVDCLRRKTSFQEANELWHWARTQEIIVVTKLL